MNYPDVDDVVNYLSTKFNKIFCDRDFVCCVTQDFRTILNNKSQRCVLVFPVLGPIFLKAVRYQARIFDLAAFTIGCGKFKSVAVCHKDHLIKKTNEVVKEEVMAEVSCSRRKRPARELYVPPAQRRTRPLRTKSDSASAKPSNSTDKANKTSCDEPTVNKCDLEEQTCNIVLSLGDVVDGLYHLNLLPLRLGLKMPPARFSHQKCDFKKFFDSANSIVYNQNILLYKCCSFQGYYCWQFDLEPVSISVNNFRCYPVFSFDAETVDLAEKPLGILTSYNYLSDTFQNLMFDSNNIEYCVCRTGCEDEKSDCWKLVDLSHLGHCSIILFEGTEYFFQCQENHDPTECCTNKRQELESTKQLEGNKPNIEDQEVNSDSNKCQLKSGTKPLEANKSNIENHEVNSNKCQLESDSSAEKKLDDVEVKKTKQKMESAKSKSNMKEKKVVNTSKHEEHEEEKEIMRKTKENINRKTRPIMKYVDDRNDTLKIDKNESVNNWEDLFNDEGQIQEELLAEIVEKVGDAVTIVTATEDYTDYTTKPPEDLEHVVELYNFPSSLETHDLVQAFSDINSDAMYIKWVDETHALLVLGSLSQAQKAISMGHPLIKVRPMTVASANSIDVANKSDLKPAMKRPPTNLQTARRLITSHLGTKSRLTKEQMAKEKQDLKNAREMKRIIKQSRKDAWEGNIRSSVK